MNAALRLSLVLLLVASPAAAKHRRHHASTPAKPVLWKDFRDHPAGYLAKAAVKPDALAFLPPPPAPDSPRGKADRAIYEAAKEGKGSARWEQARADAEVETPEAVKAFTCAAGVTLSPRTTPVTALLLARMMSDAGAAEDRAKDAYARKRPFLADDGDICVEKEAWLVKQGSYPSGHAATGWAWALVLSELEPDRADALARRGLDFGESRLVCRVHFASDVEAGRAVGAAVVARLHADPAFLADMKRAKAELARARVSTPAPASSKGCDSTAAAPQP